MAIHASYTPYCMPTCFGILTPVNNTRTRHRPLFCVCSPCFRPSPNSLNWEKRGS
jgi:hypothetical protein